jgi:hypothetical protein
MIFIHFEPTGHSLGRNETGYFYVKEEQDDGGSVRGSGSRKEKINVDQQYRQDTKQGFGGQSASYGGLPPYLKRKLLVLPVSCVIYVGIKKRIAVTHSKAKNCLV